MKYVLIGFKGAGKTTVGMLLAKKLNLPFFDTDHLLLQKFPNIFSCKELFCRIGEKTFREEEEKAVFLLKDVTHAVIATGGGAILLKKNRQVLFNKAKVIYLSASLDVLKQRVADQPAFLHSFDQSIQIAYDQRIDYYKKYADITVHLKKENPAEALKKVMKCLKE